MKSSGKILLTEVKASRKEDCHFPSNTQELNDVEQVLKTLSAL